MKIDSKEKNCDKIIRILYEIHRNYKVQFNEKLFCSLISNIIIMNGIDCNYEKILACNGKVFSESHYNYPYVLSDIKKFLGIKLNIKLPFDLGPGDELLALALSNMKK